MDPRYDAAFQRGFAGGVDRVRGDERAFARPGTGPTRTAQTVAGLPPIGAAARTRRELRATPPAPSRAPLRLPPADEQPALPTTPEAPWESSAEDETRPGPPEASRRTSFLRNPWLLALLLAGLAGSALGLFVLYTGYSSPPASYYGDSDTPSPAWIQRQILYYASIPLLGCLPFSLLLAIAVGAVQWKGRAVRTPDAQTPEAPNSSPSR
ncbi:hypothetical protein [Rathayibacter sp. VKM Ac-2754]|uniref:hypothetical protein n=1 Tax=Rathayibacter sp. VKM Ac-2754 TaxID=2609251 RepID=UPI00135A8F2C|nr:hypothetical protein [Rathayibacter sp. VKM Ac-2754]MWV57449.1 hypothetical protein [Rathayibacter sp. VKM Ac-2754]